MRIKKIISVISGIIVIVAVLEVTGILDLLFHGTVFAAALLGASFLVGTAKYWYGNATDSRTKEWNQTGC